MSRRLVITVVGSSAAPAELPAKGKLVVGSSSERAGLLVEGQGVADVHCAIGRIKGGGWALKDMGSTFGTIVNGKKISSARLAHGDVILVGSRRLLVSDPERAEEAPATEAPTGDEPKAEPTAAPPAPRTPPRSAPEEAPLEIAGYRIAHMLGRGGMGEVYLAEQTRLARKVAVKVLARRLGADAQFVSRFEAEARAAAAFNHPNVVTVYDVGVDHGHHYLSMEYMDAGCLESRLQNLGPIPWREALSILHDATSGLVYAESRGIVHRDIKPANLMQNQDGVTKLADLGLAVQVEQEELQAEGRRVFGTPHFIAPELIRGGKPDSRSDLYSLGATAYRILSGHTPFEGSTTKEILRGALQDDPEPLDARVPGLPHGIAVMVQRLLEKDPNDRYPSAAILLSEIDRLRSGDTGAKPVATARSRLPIGRLVAGAVIVVGLAIGGNALKGGGSTDPEGPGPGPAPDDVGGEVVEGPGVPEIDHVDEGPTDTDPERDEDRAKLFETEARVAYLELANKLLSEPDRIAALRKLASDYPGTDSARDAVQAANKIESRLASERAAEEAARTARQGVLDALRVAASLDADPPRPGDALRAMRLVPGQAELGGDPDFVAERKRIEGEVLAKAVEFADSLWNQAADFEDDGDFESMVAKLGDILPLVDLPDFDEGDEPEGVFRLAQLATAARAKRDGVADLENEYMLQRADADRGAIAAGLGGPTGLEAELRACDLDAATTRLSATLETVKSNLARRRLEPLRDDLVLARSAITALGDAWSADGWRRKSVLDPQSRRTSNRDAVGVSPGGVLLAGDEGAEEIPWSAWIGHGRELDNLFHERLHRDWTADELRGIAALLRVSAVVSAIDAATPMLSAGSDARFRERDASDLLDVYEQAAEWAEASGTRPVFEIELAAAETLIEALLATTEGQWTLAATGLSRLLEEHDASLLVMLLSDGTAWE